MEKTIIAEKIEQPVLPAPSMFGGTHKVLITETRKDEAGNDYQFTRVERVSVDTLTAQKAQLQSQIDLIDEKLSAVNLKK